MEPKSSRPSRWEWFSPWLIIGSVCILAGILAVLAVKNVHREKEFTERALLSQANILMRSLEAGSRTGMMGQGWGRRQLQVLIEETAQQPDVLYVAVVTRSGQIMAHSDPDKVGVMLPVSLPPQGQTMHRFTSEGQESFEVVRGYQPWFKQRRGRPGNTCLLSPDDEDRDLFIMVGLDPQPFDDASRQDLHQTILLFGIMLLVGAAGFLSLIWAQHYRTAKRSLQDIQALTSTIVNQMPVGLILTNRDGEIRKTNEAAVQILRSSIEIKGRIDSFPCLLPVAEQLKRHDVVLEQEVLFRDRAGETITVPLLVNAAVIHDGERRSAGYAFLFTDMTNIKQLEEQLRRSERLAALGRLAAGIAHEIRNPLSSIKGFAAILAGRFREEERSRKIADVMVQEVDRLDRVVTELLDFARPTELHKQPSDCGALIRHSLQLVEGDALRQNVKIEWLVQPEDMKVEVDPDRFAQILLNLYLNSLQAMESGGTLKIEAARHDDQVFLAVTDSGKGIAPEHLAHVFDPYFTTKPRGAGLGLANVHKLIEAHGGDIEVESSPGMGSSFVIRLPVCECPVSCGA
jgi:two-component system, NtrC family, sensor histidine kinase HydH